MENNIPAIYNDCDRILVSEQEIAAICDRLAAEILDTYKDSNRRLVMVVILKGSMPFAAELMKRLPLPLELEFMKVSSYGKGTVSGGRINILLDLHRSDLSEKDILIVEDIIDSGRTLSYLVEYLTLNGARSVKTVSLLDKPSRREVEYTPDYRGMEIPDEFVVGYGLDYAEGYRTLPYVGVLKPEVYTK